MSRYRYDAYSVKIKRWRNKLAAIKYLGGKCKKCGLECEEDMVGIFSFHHRHPSEKDFAISDKYDRLSWVKIKAELDKCDLVCNNCHGRIHATLQNDQSFLDDVFDYHGELDIWLWGREKPEPTKGSRLHKNMCPECKKEFRGQKRRKYCSTECSRKAHRKVERPSKEVLQKEIETTSILATGRKYGVSDNTVRKWARAYGIL
ncbi:MAG: hypothetical protein COT73_02000 [Bdellovibrio sp. CG10_big_fil_rev_8_21_14_0_10_47_8]|nr:MAG: hypothetical protein COT73_02000 [Bdellovibrio sp. CG10_big_fil_rev_8_21_14_0_10_47_8]